MTSRSAEGQGTFGNTGDTSFNQYLQINSYRNLGSTKGHANLHGIGPKLEDIVFESPKHPDIEFGRHLETDDS